ncbi:hypothetical protein QWY85_00895, partial [Neolewinella lacunae]|nr:hypothetical protein [Neolewinella lacunae]
MKAFYFRLLLGSFLCLSGGWVLAQGACITSESGSLTYNGSTSPSVYAPGTLVELCYTINDFQTPDVEWIHSVFLASAGPGFDYSTLMPSGTPPPSCSPQGVWGWYPSWTRCISCPNGSTFTNGYAFDSRAGTNDACGDPGQLDGDPGNNYGDNDGSCGLTFCFSMVTVDATGIPVSQAYQVNIRVLADGVSGGYTGSRGFCGSPCDDDPEVCFPEVPNPTVTILNSACPGELFDLQGGADGPILPNTEAFWLDAAGNQIATGFNVSLPAGTYTFGLRQPGCAAKTFEVTAELTIPEFTFTGEEDGAEICYGEPFNYTISVSGSQINSVQWTLNSAVVGTGPSYGVSAATPANSGEYRVIVSYGDNCDTTLTRNLTVGPNIAVDITPVNGDVCSGNEITFTATLQGGGSFAPGVELFWDGGAGTESTYTIVAGSPGPALVNLVIVDPLGCMFEYNHPYTVNPLPEVSISPLEAEVCFNSSLVLTSTVTNGLPPYNYLWGPEEVVTTANFTIAPPYPFTDGIYLVVTDANGCIGISDPAIVTLLPPPLPPNITCEALCPSEIRFTWDQANANYFQLYATINANLEVLIENNYQSRSYTFTGLNPDDRVRLRVVPFGGTFGMQSCEGPSRFATCRTPLTYDPGWVLNFPSTVCRTANNAQFDLSAMVTEPGTFRFTSASLGLNDFLADADNTTSIPLPALAPGQLSEVHQIRIDYAGVGGRCPADTTISITVLQAPDPAFTLAQDQLCAATGTFRVSVTSPAAGGTYAVGFDNPAVGSVTAVSPTEWDLSTSQPGTHGIFVVASNNQLGTCADTARATITLQSPPAAPVVECLERGLDSVTFIWTDTGAETYLINQISVPGYAVTERIGNRFIVRNLMVDDAVTISVTAQETGCPDAVSAQVTCVAESCPDISITVDALGPFCVDNNGDQALNATISGSDGSGTLSWLVNGSPAGSSINPANLGVGTFTIRALFSEGCDFFAETTVTINPVPSSAFSLADDRICTGETTLGAAAGAVQVGWSYVFSAPGATVTPGSNAASRNFRWSTPGRKFVTLTVTNQFNCVSTVTTDSIDVELPLELPVISCVDPAQNTLTFTWNAPVGVDSFGISLNGGPLFFQDSTRLFLTGLAIDSLVQMELFIYGDTPCPILVPALGACRTTACPSLVLTPPLDAAFCLTGDTLPVVLSATITGASEPGTFLFAGNGVTDDLGTFSFDPRLAGPGIHRILVDYIETNCTAQDSFFYTVTATPPNAFTANGTLGDLTICQDDILEVDLDISSLNGAQGTFAWDFGGLPVLDSLSPTNFVLGTSNSGQFTIRLVSTVEGCSSLPFSAVITIDPIIPAPVISCGTVTRNSVTITWPGVPGAEGYLVSDGTMLPASATSYTITGLAPGEMVSVTVSSLSSNFCGDSAPSAAANCQAEACPAFTLDRTGVVDLVCLLNGNETLDLSTAFVTGGNGNGATYTFSGPGVSGTTFDAAAAGGSEAGTTHTINVTYSEEGPCDFTGTFDVIVFARPSVLITLSDPACVGEAVSVVISSGNPIGNADITVDWDGGSVQPDADPTDNEYLVVWDTPGTKNITATVVSNLSGCPSEPALAPVEIIAPLDAPVVSCGTPAELESITFNWGAVVDATGYALSLSDGTMVTLTAAETSFTVSGLSPGTTLTISIYATGTGPCPDGPATTLECSTAPCPPGLAMATTPDTEFCNGQDTDLLPLSATLTVGAPQGSFTWSGPGVVVNNGDFFFDPTAVGPGVHVLTVAYDGPSICDSQDEVTMTIFGLPLAGLDPTPAQVCAGTAIDVSLADPVDAGTTYIWDWDGGIPTDLGNQTYSVRWDTPGTKTVTVTATAECTVSNQFTIEVIAPLSAPVVSCGTPEELESITFNWDPVVGATGYELDFSDGNSATLTAAETSFTVSGLDPGTTLTISIYATGTGPCPDGPTTTLECSTAPCPPGLAMATTPDTEF